MARPLRITLFALALLSLAPIASAQVRIVELPLPPPPPTIVVAPPPPPPPPPIVVAPDAHAHATVSGEVALPAPPPLVLPPIDVPFRFAAELLFGFTNMDPAVDGSTFGLGLQLEIAPLPWLAIGARGGWSVSQDVGLDLNRDGLDDLEETGPFNLVTITAGPRFRIPTSPRGQDAFVLELGGGYGYVVDGLRPSGALLEIAISRWGDAGGAGGGPVVRLQQGLGDAGSLTTVLVGVQGGIDTSSETSEGRSSFRYTLGWDLALGGGFLEQGLVSHGFAAQVGMAFGIPIADVLEPRVRVDFGHRVAGEGIDGLETYGASGALRLLLDEWVPLYLEAGGGWAFRFGTRAAEVTGGAFLDVGAGARLIDCEGSPVAVTLGVRARIGLLGSDALTAIYGTIGVEYDSLPSRTRPRCIPAPPEVIVEGGVELETPRVEPAPQPAQPSQPAQPQPAQPQQPAVHRGGGAFVEASARVPSGPTRVPLRFGLEALFGLADADLSMEGPISGAAATFGVAFDRNWGIDLRLSALGGPDALLQDPALRDHVDALSTPGPLLLTAGGGPRLVVWSDEDSRIGWHFELTGSYAYLEGSRDGVGVDPQARYGRHGAVIEVGIGPQIGERFEDHLGFDFGLTLRLQQGLGDLIEYRAILLALRIGFEGDTPEPHGTPDRPADFQYTVGAQLAFGVTPGADTNRGIAAFTSVGRLSGHFGLPIGRWLELRARGGVGPRNVTDDRSIWILDVGGAARLRFDEVFPLYLEAGAGYAFQYGPSVAQAPAGAIVDAGIGVRFTDCTGGSDGALELGLGARFGVESDRTNDALFVTLGFDYGGGTPMYGENERWHCSAIMHQGGGDAVIEERTIERRDPGELDAQVEVEAPAYVPPPTYAPPPPQTFEIVIGVAVPGAELRLAPEALPFAALAGAGFVRVELLGPAQALPRAEAELRAAFGARGVRLDAVTHVAGWDPTLRARITVYPPGTR